MQTAAHSQKCTIHLVYHIPAHGPRGAKFEKAKERMKAMGLYKCAIPGCKSGAQLEAHHHIENSLQEGVDIQKVNTEYGLTLDDKSFADWVQSPGNLEILCMRGDTLVATPHGARAIETLRVGDPVIGGCGQPHPVLGKWQRPHHGPLYDLGNAFLTSDHALLTRTGWQSAATVYQTQQDVRMTMPQMFGMRGIQTQVLDPVVELISIEVMDALGRQQSPTQMLFHNEPMLKDDTSFAAIPNAHASIARWRQSDIAIASSSWMPLQVSHAASIGAELLDYTVTSLASQEAELTMAFGASEDVPTLSSHGGAVGRASDVLPRQRTHDGVFPLTNRANLDDAIPSYPPNGFWSSVNNAHVLYFRGQVHDITLPHCRSFLLANGMTAHNCAVHHRTLIGIHYVPAAIWPAIRVWRDDMPPPVEHVA